MLNLGKRIAAKPTTEEFIEEVIDVKEERRVPLPTFGFVAASSDDRPPVLSRKQPYQSAQEFVARNCIIDGHLALFYHEGGFWGWDGSCYGKWSEAEIHSSLWEFLDDAKTNVWSKPDEEGEEGTWSETPFHPTPKDVGAVLSALKAGLTLESGVSAPAWFEDAGEDLPKVDNLFPFKNCLVDFLTGEIVPHSPALWIHGGVDYDYIPDAKCPRWERFLEEVLPGDKEAQDCIEEALGYSMTNDVSMEKGFMLIGEKRSGRGTITHVLEGLIGEDCYAALDESKWLAQENSKHQLIGKKAGVFADMRLKPPKKYGANLDPGGMDYKSVATLLKIMSGDRDSIKLFGVGTRWNGVLPMKIWLLSNVVPRLNDSGGALPSRFIKFRFDVSFYGREDKDLKKILRREVPGIAIRCLSAYRRLMKRGSFIQPESGLRLDKMVRMYNDPFSEWFYTHWTYNLECKGTPHRAIYEDFIKWCNSTGHLDELPSLNTPSLFSQRLKKFLADEGIVEDLKTIKPFKKPRIAVGIERLVVKEDVVQETA